jgi:hypothetical protein
MHLINWILKKPLPQSGEEIKIAHEMCKNIHQMLSQQTGKVLNSQKTAYYEFQVSTS